ncbi:CHAT domain-containing protein [Nonomuraea sp. NPDC050691]|uniref:CHAT domain-containing protein n=1 Tax=Nonomuraea sp. NPDC050691 TaxID=3155661 RepID=UPI0033EEEEE4
MTAAFRAEVIVQVRALAQPVQAPGASRPDPADRRADLHGLDGARLAHLAAHGRLHAAHPLFSSLHLSDGPLTLYDLERLRRAPRVVVLAACESGRSIVRAGDELLGLSATFLAHGARTVIASVVPVPDAETASPMAALHRLLAAGRSAATALAEAQGEVSGDLPGASAGFVCIGADVRLDPPGLPGGGAHAGGAHAGGGDAAARAAGRRGG